MTCVNAESAAIGAALISEACAGLVFTQLAEEDFLAEDLARCFAELQKLWQRDGRVDAATIARAASAQTARACMETVPSVTEASCAAYIRHVSDAARVRRAQAIALGIATEGESPEKILERCAAMEKALSGRREAGWMDAAQGFERFYARQRGDAPQYIKCGVLPTFDRITFLQRGDLLLIGGRPSAGKTMASLNLAAGWAKKGHRVAYFSLETSPDKIWDRLIAAEFRLDFTQVKRGQIPTSDGELGRDAEAFCRLPIQVCQAAGRSVAWMRAQAARLKADVAVVDYVQLVRAGGDSRYEQVTQVSIDLHEWAQADSVLVVGLCQLNRQGEGGPKLADLRESGQLEQDADAVVLLNKLADPDTGATEYHFDLAKNKEGICGRIPMVFDGAHQTLRELALEEAGPEGPAGGEGFAPYAAPLPEAVQQRFGGEGDGMERNRIKPCSHRLDRRGAVPGRAALPCLPYPGLAGGRSRPASEACGAAGMGRVEEKGDRR